ncbi:MAG: hypothetical protein AAF547_10835 [Actinomycetota bacterium]
MPLALALGLVIALSACGDDPDDEDAVDQTETVEAGSEADQDEAATAEEGDDEQDEAGPNDDTDDPDGDDPAEDDQQAEDQQDEDQIQDDDQPADDDPPAEDDDQAMEDEQDDDPPPQEDEDDDQDEGSVTPQLPSQEITINFSGPDYSQGPLQLARSQDCGGPCTVEIYDSQDGANALSFTSQGGEEVAVAQADPCYRGSWLAFPSERAGQTCAVRLVAPATDEYRETTIDVTFKATAATVYTWVIGDTDPATTETLTAGQVFTIPITITRTGQDFGFVAPLPDNATLFTGNLRQGEEVVEGRAGGCGQTASVTFTVSMGGTSFGNTDRSETVSWNVVCTEDPPTDEPPPDDS